MLKVRLYSTRSDQWICVLLSPHAVTTTLSCQSGSHWVRSKWNSDWQAVIVEVWSCLLWEKWRLCNWKVNKGKDGTVCWPWIWYFSNLESVLWYFFYDHRFIVMANLTWLDFFFEVGSVLCEASIKTKDVAWWIRTVVFCGQATTKANDSSTNGH